MENSILCGRYGDLTGSYIFAKNKATIISRAQINMAKKLSFSPKDITGALLEGLPDRSRAILVDRYGLKRADRRTLEAIGGDYQITRERVRQIENHGLAAIRASEAYRAYQKSLDELKSALEDLGGVLGEDTVVEVFAEDPQEARHLVFLLTLGTPFAYGKENADLVARWHVNPSLAEQVQNALSALSDAIARDDLIAEEEIIERFSNILKEAGVKKFTPEQLLRWLTLSKRIGKNPLGEWGKSDSPHVRVKSMRDFAYLTLKRHGSPMHFTEVAKTIEQLFNRKAHPATCHNELINDQRFVLVGRGLYALNEWGYSPGVVREVIRTVLEKEPEGLTREEIIERVKRERYVKDATITVNLQDPMFSVTPEGKYTVAKK